MKICLLKIDTKGRVQIPKSFLDANEISIGQKAFLEVINSNNNAVRLSFLTKEQSRSL